MKAVRLFACSAALCLALNAQSDQSTRRLTDQQLRKREAKLRKELYGPYLKWLREDVAYIITEEERKEFVRLRNDSERDQFIEQFWLIRDPTPDTSENEFKEQHYRRIAYANERFGYSSLPGWKTDRGRIYITFGPPDEIKVHSSEIYLRPDTEGGGTTTTYPFEQWYYRSIEGIGLDITIEFVDTTLNGEYHLVGDAPEKKVSPDVFGLPAQSPLRILASREFETLGRYAKLQRPAVPFRELETLVTSTVNDNVLPVKVRADFLRMTDSTVLIPVTVQFDNNDLQFLHRDGVQRATVNLYLRVTSKAGRLVSVQEDVMTMEFPTGTREEQLKRGPMYGKPCCGPLMSPWESLEISVYQKAFYLQPGNYRVNVVAKDATSGNRNNIEQVLEVPRFEPGRLSASNIILADLIETSPSHTGRFFLGDWKVRPRVSGIFRRDERMGFYLQVYEMSADEKTGKPDGSVLYQVIGKGSDKAAFEFSEDISSLPGASSQQVTVAKMLPLASLEPGDYVLKIVVTDRYRNQVLTPTAGFSVR